MKLSEYQLLAAVTLPRLESVKLDLSHMCLGMMTEIVEYIHHQDNINVKEELGDIMWYIAGYCTIRNKELSSLSVREDLNKDILIVIGDFTDMVKRHIAYNTSINEEKEHYLLSLLCTGVLSSCIKHHISFENVLITNIEKLKKRFPNGFTEYHAVNRNLEEERKILEQ